MLYSFLIENHVICVPSTTAKWISFQNHRNRKVVRGKHNILVLYVNASAPDPSGVVLCNTLMRYFVFIFDQKSYGPKYIHFSLNLLYIPPRKLEHRIDSLSSLGHLPCIWKVSSSQPTIYKAKTNQGLYLKYSHCWLESNPTPILTGTSAEIPY